MMKDKLFVFLIPQSEFRDPQSKIPQSKTPQFNNFLRRY